MNKAKRIESRRVFDGKVVELFVDRVVLPNGNETSMEVARLSGAAAVVPVDGEDRVVLVRQYRYAVDDWVLEIPAGKLDKDEAPQSCASRELQEETGYRAGRLVGMGFTETGVGFCDERIWLFLATDIMFDRQRLEADEVLSVVHMDLEEAVAKALSGEITDAKSVCGLLRASHYLERSADGGRGG